MFMLGVIKDHMLLLGIVGNGRCCCCLALKLQELRDVG
jgi:hypothetical protein